MSLNKYKGERLDLDSSLSAGVLVEHLSRYQQVAGTSDSEVLDVGCGAGHGSRLLAKHFCSVKGLDISEEAVRDAERLSGNVTNPTFICGSALEIPLPENSVDIVSAFEVFEHLDDWQGFLRELKRVVRPCGLIYISTPNKNIYSPGRSTPWNPHHRFEMTPSEFREALLSCFTVLNLFGQRTPVYNDNPIWQVLRPMLDDPAVPSELKNTFKLATCNWIEPDLKVEDVVFSAAEEEIAKSRFLLAVCQNT